MNNSSSENSEPRDANTSEVDEHSPISPKASHQKSPRTKRIDVEAMPWSASSNAQMLQLTPVNNSLGGGQLSPEGYPEPGAFESAQVDSNNASHVAFLPQTVESEK